MMGGFKCSRNSLIVLNFFYFIVGIMLIAIGGHWITSNIVTSLPIIGGVIACGVFLSMLSVAGLVAAVKHHQVLLFFYMVIMLVVFLIQFSIACACLTVSTNAQKDLSRKGWMSVDNETKSQVQNTFECCGYDDFTLVNATNPLSHPSCSAIDLCMSACKDSRNCCSPEITACGCDTCSIHLEKVTAKAFSVTGGVSLFFSFTEFFGVWLAYRYRNQRNPYVGNPSAFL